MSQYVDANLKQLEYIDTLFTDVHNHILDESLTIPLDSNFGYENDI